MTGRPDEPVIISGTRVDELAVRMRDGVKLATEIHLPPGRGPFPAILTRTPYDKSAYPNNRAVVVDQMHDRGYAFVAQDTRGKHHSEGTAVAFAAEMLDAYDTLEWLSSQRWCDGRIGMWGDSYCGFTQWAAAASGHPSLKAIVPANTAARMENLIYRQGVFELALAVPWAAASWIDGAQHEIEPWDFDWSVRPLRAVLAAATGGSDSPSLRRWREAPPGDPFWTREIYVGRDPLLHSTVPALHLGGWWDLFRYEQAPEWARAGACSPVPRWLVMDATDHGLFEWSASPVGIPDRDWWDSEQMVARVPDQLLPQLDFYDRVLRGTQRPAPAAVRWRLTHAGWRDADTWPPAGTQPLCLHLADARAATAASVNGGALTARADRHARWSTWVHDPDQLVPSQERTAFLVLADPPEDDRVASRPDVLTFTSAPLPTELDLCGPVVVELVIGSSAPSMHAVVKLLDLIVDGSTRRICDGAGTFVTAEDERRALVGLGDVGYRVRAGHRLGLQIASSDFPRYLPHPGNHSNPWDAVVGERNTQRLRIGGEWGSRLWLTVLNASSKAPR